MEPPLPSFNSIIKDTLSLHYSLPVVGYLVAGMVLITILAGIYPSFYLTRFQPVQVLKGDVTKGKGGGVFRKILLVVQFTISIALIASTIIVHRQLGYINRYDTGFNKDHIVMFKMNKDQKKNLESFRNELVRKPGIRQVSFANQPQGEVRWTNSLTINGEEIGYKFAPVDPYHIDLMGLNLIQGRDFRADSETDKQYTFILNEKAVEAFGLEEPVVGQTVKRQGHDVKIIGVVEDYHFNSLHETIEPLVLGWQPQWLSMAYVKIDGQNVKESLQDLEEVWMDFSPSFPVKYSFLDEQFEQLYRTEQRMASIFIYFSALAIFIAALGLFGLAAFTAGQKRKEIGIRKVLGAPVERIIGKLIKDFTVWAVVANIIAWPVAWYFMEQWLSNFAYAYDIDGTAFLAAALITLFISVATVFYQAWRSAQMNPVEALRYE
ncbi:MAG: FtsX-like permease family protein [Bacteroidales bacterium]|nr:FtsX-like permease family protein [Bacteroidales bacterium]